MIDTVYVEEAVRSHPRTRAVLGQLPRATVIECSHYGEVFNAHRQNFRLQKQRPALILARKQGELLHEVPPGFGVGGSHDHYFSHLLNCPYDCRYCFLQGMFRSAHYVLFVDFQAFFDAIAARTRELLARDPAAAPWFFSGYDCDSLALDGLTGFAGEALRHFETSPSAFLELRTKSVQTAALRSSEPLPNVLTAFSLSPQQVVAAVEAGTPSLARRLPALRTLAEHGWSIGLRFDPVLWFEGAKDAYLGLFEEVARAAPNARVHSVSLGAFRLPKGFHRALTKLYPNQPLLAAVRDDGSGEVTYPRRVIAELLQPLEDRLIELWGAERCFSSLGEGTVGAAQVAPTPASHTQPTIER